MKRRQATSIHPDRRTERDLRLNACSSFTVAYESLREGRAFKGCKGAIETQKEALLKTRCPHTRGIQQCVPFGAPGCGGDVCRSTSIRIGALTPGRGNRDCTWWWFREGDSFFRYLAKKTHCMRGKTLTQKVPIIGAVKLEVTAPRVQLHGLIRSSVTIGRQLLPRDSGTLMSRFLSPPR